MGAVSKSDVKGGVASFWSPKAVPIESLKAGFEFTQTGVPAPDNSCPIYGRTKIDITHCGKNFLENNFENSVNSHYAISKNEDGSFYITGTHDAFVIVSYNLASESANSGATQRDYIKHIPNGKYIVGLGEGIFGPALQSQLINRGETAVVIDGYYRGFDRTKPFVVDDTYDCNYFRLVCYSNSNYNHDYFAPAIYSLNESDLTYEPYKGETFSIDWTDEVGEVYGGYVDLITGELVATYYEFDFTADKATRIDSVTDNCVVVVCVPSTYNLPAVTASTSIISNRFLTAVESDTPGKLATLNDQIYIKLPKADMTGTDLTAAKQWLANNPTQIVYKLTTPIHMQLSSTFNIQSYVGRNNFFSDGAIIEAEYEYIESQDLMWRKRIIQNAAHPAHAEPGTISGAPSITRFETDIAAPLKSCVVSFEPQQEGSGDPSPSNVRSFKAGYTGTRITIAGKNLYKIIDTQRTINGIIYSVNNGVITGSGEATANAEFYFKHLPDDYIPAGNYLFSVDGLIDTWNDTLIWDTTSGGRSKSWDGTKQAASDNYGGAFQFYEVAVVEGHTQSQMIRIKNGKSVTNHSWYPMFCMPDETDLTFEPFIGDKYSYSWQSSVGTIYGGQLDLKTGILVVTHQLISLGTPAQSKSRITSISKRSTGMTTFWFWFARSGSIIEGRDMATDKYILCDKLKPGSTANDVTYSTVPTISNYAANVYPGSLYLSAPTAEVGTTTDSIWAWMLANPFQIVTHLKTPLTYQLDPITINALKGKNNMWSDNGKLSIEYWTH